MEVLGLHLITDERQDPNALLVTVDRAVAEGASVVQVRSKNASARELIAMVASVSRVVAGRAAVLVNDRVDVAIAAQDEGAHVDGVHLGQCDLPPVTARRLLGPGAIIGWSANTVVQLGRAAAFPPGTLDYLGVGVIHSTATKADHPPVIGVEGFTDLAASTTLPCVAVGGLTAEDVVPLRRAGATGMAVVSAISGADDPGAATHRFLSAWEAMSR